MSPVDILGQRIEDFQVLSPSVSNFADGLRRRGYRVCAFDDLDIEGYGSEEEQLKYDNLTLKELLDRFVEQNSNYVWEKVGEDIINIFPKESILDLRLPKLDIRKKDLYKILLEDLKIEEKGIYIFSELMQTDKLLVDLHIEDSSLRYALNEIVAQLGETVWHISGRSGAYYLTLTNISENEGQ